MTKKYRFPPNRFKSSTNQAMKGIGNTVSKGTVNTAKWMAGDHFGDTDCSNRMGMMQNINFIIARLKLIKRQSDRDSKRSYEYIETGYKGDPIERIIEWLFDHSLFVLDVLAAYLSPIFSLLILLLYRSLLIVIWMFVLFYGLYLLTKP